MRFQELLFISLLLPWREGTGLNLFLVLPFHELADNRIPSQASYSTGQPMIGFLILLSHVGKRAQAHSLLSDLSYVPVGIQA